MMRVNLAVCCSFQFQGNLHFAKPHGPLRPVFIVHSLSSILYIVSSLLLEILSCWLSRHSIFLLSTGSSFLVSFAGCFFSVQLLIVAVLQGWVLEPLSLLFYILSLSYNYTTKLTSCSNKTYKSLFISSSLHPVH